MEARSSSSTAAAPAATNGATADAADRALVRHANELGHGRHVAVLLRHPYQGLTAFGRAHVILDNLNTHKKNERWLKKHPKVHFHFTPTRSSWLNQIETWFSILQGQSLNGASFTAVEQLQEHIDAFIAAYNETAEPFAWTKKRVYQRRFKNRRITQL